MTFIARFISLNRRLCRRIEERLPANFRLHLRTAHKREVARFLNSRPDQVVLDIGAGRECAFLPFIDNPGSHLMIGMDVSEHELRYNRDVLVRVVADAASAYFPIMDNSVDLVISHSVVEHIPDNGAFIEHCAQVLRPGGVIVHTFASKFAPFALINQLIPNRLARRLLSWFQPHWRQDAVGFPAFYSSCYFSALKRLLARSGFVNAEYKIRYYQSEYFDFFLPLYLLMLGYDLIAWISGIRNLACGIVVSAEWQGPSKPTLPLPSLASHSQISHQSEAADYRI